MSYWAVVVLVLVLWLNGRYWRSRWDIEPTLHHHPATGGDGRTIAFLWTGAFNDATIHFERLIPLYRQVADVCVIRYADRRFGAHEAIRAAHEYARIYGYGHVILVGASLGGEEALRYEEYAPNVANVGRHHPALQKILCDVPPNGKYLPQPAWLSRFVKYVHIGPLFNLLSPIVTHLMFKKLNPSQMNGVDTDHLNRHMAAMWGCKLSAILEQIAAIGVQPSFTNIAGAPGVYLKCEADKVIKGDASLAKWRTLIGTSLLKVINVEGDHVQFVENHIPWYNAHAHALRILGYVVR